MGIPRTRDIRLANANFSTQPPPLPVRTTVTHFNALQRIATHHNTLQHTATHCNTMQHTATHCNTLQYNKTEASWYGVALVSRIDKIIGLFCKETYKRDDILQKRPIILSILLTVATPYQEPRPILLKHTAPHYTTLHHTAPYCTSLHHSATHCNTLQHTAGHCNRITPPPVLLHSSKCGSVGPIVCGLMSSYVTCLVHMFHDEFICDMPHSYVTCFIIEVPCFIIEVGRPIPYSNES